MLLAIVPPSCSAFRPRRSTSNSSSRVCCTPGQSRYLSTSSWLQPTVKEANFQQWRHSAGDSAEASFKQMKAHSGVGRVALLLDDSDRQPSFAGRPLAIDSVAPANQPPVTSQEPTGPRAPTNSPLTRNLIHSGAISPVRTEPHQENYTSLVGLTSLVISLESLRHLMLQPQLPFKLEVSPSGDSSHTRQNYSQVHSKSDDM